MTAEERAGRLRDLDVDLWPGAERWWVSGSRGSWTATRPYVGAEISLTCSTLNDLIAACRDFDRRTA